jgi:hypothetical protein
MQRFDIDKFNKEFVDFQEENKKEHEEKEKEKLVKLNEPKVEIKKLYQMSLYDIMVGIKNTWFGILDDTLNFQFNLETVTKNNRLFFIGCTFFMIAVLIFFYNFFFESEETVKNNPQIINIHHFVPNNNIVDLPDYKFTQ